ncbi:hypothetical protein V5O48_013428 [Marasmius crinis-equi]|uniref:Nephrocystin 3-like N-terminal domain-containing protein n=1 Tax=Marasmius crinis-equi TaxID=585013 RepID=A0ABR3F0H8_9AGAR
MNVQNTNSELGRQNNYNAPGQNINHGGDQLVGVIVGRDLVRNFTTTTSNPYKSLWDAIAGVGASHRAEQQSGVPPICWLSGPAGVEKTAIAKSCEENGLIESFFFFRSDPRRNNPSALMLVIAHGLGVRIPRLEPSIARRITADPGILEATLDLQFRELILKPSQELVPEPVTAPAVEPAVKPVVESVAVPWWRWLSTLFRTREASPKDPRSFFIPSAPTSGPSPLVTPRDPNLVIIDGLDECSDSETQLRILATISGAYQHTPRSPLRFLICSRPESWIRQAFQARPLRNITRSIVLDNAFSPCKDIERYLIHELEGIRESPDYTYIEFPTPWPSQEDYDCLVERSDGQFVYVVTAVKFVKIPHCNPVKQLRIIIDNAPVTQLTKSPYPELDNLYHVILAANPDPDTVWAILAAVLLLPHEAIDDEGRTKTPEWLGLLFGLSSGEIILALRAMHSVLDIRSPQDRIRVYHTSFIDYLFDPVRSREFYIDKLEVQHALARRWLQSLSRDWIGGYR